MEIINNTNNIRCEFGTCRNRAERAIAFGNLGPRGRIYVCDKCLNELYEAIGKTVVPKSLETAKPRSERKKESK